MRTIKCDCIIVGAGPAGSAAAITLAKSGLEVVLIERGEYPGSKNVMGGVLYRQPTAQLVPDFWKEAPIERPIVEQRYWLLDWDSAVTFGYKSKAFGEEPHNNYSVLRAKFDEWFAEQAVEAGAILITETNVEDLLYQGERVIGVRTGRPEGDIFAEVVIIAEGVNSMLTQKAGLQKDGLNTAQLAVTVKEIISLPREKIEERFNLEEGQGATIELIGDATQGMVGTGFIYTNKDSLSVGVGALLSQVVRQKVNPNELLERMKNHPLIRPLLKDGETKEYLGHLIPEGGYQAIPKLCKEGLLVVGDAAMFVNGIHREGSNMAMISGKLAGEAVIEAKEKGDFSEKQLSSYERELKKSFIVKDLRKYQNVATLLETNEHFFTLYPHLLNDAALNFLTVDMVPKKEKQAEIMRKVFSERSKLNIVQDLYRLWRVMG